MNDNLDQMAWIAEIAGYSDLDSLFFSSPVTFMTLSQIWREMPEFYKRGVWG